MYAVIDIETTGGSIRWSRITEIAIFLFDGQQVLETFSSLVNPGVPIPPFISQLTGITDEMVKDAPNFQEIAPQIERLTSGAIFVAHNVAFDYNFIRHEFNLMGLPFERDRLCTVRLSRQILPGKASYSLGRLCEELSIPISARHRATGDAEATVKLMALMVQQAGIVGINAFIANGSPYEQFNKRLKSTRLEDIPQSAGVLSLLDDAGQPLFIEGTLNLRKRALAYLRNKAGRLGKTMLPQLADFSFEETGSGLFSMLLANERVLEEKPLFNKVPATQPAKRWKITATEGADGFLYLAVARSEEGEWGPFATRKLATEKLGELLRHYFLCRRYSSLKPANCAPASCLKACQGVEQSNLYNKRALAAVTATAPAAQGQLIIDKGRHRNERLVILEREPGFISWGYVDGSSKSYSKDELAAAAGKRFKSGNASVTLKRYLLKNPVLKLFSYGQEVVAAGI